MTEVHIVVHVHPYDEGAQIEAVFADKATAETFAADKMKEHGCGKEWRDHKYAVESHEVI